MVKNKEIETCVAPLTRCPHGHVESWLWLKAAPKVAVPIFMAVCLKFPPCHCMFVPISPLKWVWLLSCSFFFYFYFLWNLCLYAPSNLPSVEIPGLSTRRLRHIWREQWGDEDKITEKRKGVGFVFPKSNLFQSNYALLPVLNFLLLHCCDICMRMG